MGLSRNCAFRLNTKVSYEVKSSVPRNVIELWQPIIARGVGTIGHCAWVLLGKEVRPFLGDPATRRRAGSNTNGTCAPLACHPAPTTCAGAQCLGPGSIPDAVPALTGWPSKQRSSPPAAFSQRKCAPETALARLLRWQCTRRRFR